MRRALLCGCNYRGTSSELQGCIQDVTAAREVLITKYRFLPQNVLVLSDDTPIKPTRANMIAGFEWLLSGAKASDFKRPGALIVRQPLGTIMYFHFSGHGSYQIDRNGDEVDKRDETICPLDFMRGEIVDDYIRSTLINRVPAGSTLVSVFDCCHSGSSEDLRYTLRPDKTKAGSHFVLEDTTYYPETRGRVFYISGCRDEETSADAYIAGKFRGAMTAALLDTLGKNSYRSIRMIDLLDGMNSFLTKNKLDDQHPCMGFGRREALEVAFPL